MFARFLYNLFIVYLHLLLFTEFYLIIYGWIYFTSLKTL